jgi:hypothetical protein
MKMKNHLYTGDLASIFDGDCEFTNEILKQRKEEIREYLDDDHGISGTKILIFWRDIQYLKGMKTIEKEMEMNKEEVKLSGSTLLMLFEIKKALFLNKAFSLILSIFSVDEVFLSNVISSNI